MCRKSNKSNHVHDHLRIFVTPCFSELFVGNFVIKKGVVNSNGSARRPLIQSWIATYPARFSLLLLPVADEIIDPHNPSAYLISTIFFLLSTMFLSRSSVAALFAFAVFRSANASCPSGNDPNCAWGKNIFAWDLFCSSTLLCVALSYLHLYLTYEYAGKTNRRKRIESHFFI